MIPNVQNNMARVSITTMPSKTFKINDNETITSMTDGKEAVKQAIYLILSTPRYQHIIYSWNYGHELNNLIGKPISYVIPVTEDRIKDALMQDDRITDVTDFIFEKQGPALHVKFTAKTIFGPIETEVNVDV